MDDQAIIQRFDNLTQLMERIERSISSLAESTKKDHDKLVALDISQKNTVKDLDDFMARERNHGTNFYNKLDANALAIQEIRTDFSKEIAAVVKGNVESKDPGWLTILKLLGGGVVGGGLSGGGIQLMGGG